jgi:predicted naringenin-chalcone synthase
MLPGDGSRQEKRTQAIETLVTCTCRGISSHSVEIILITHLSLAAYSQVRKYIMHARYHQRQQMKRVSFQVTSISSKEKVLHLV